MKRRPKVMVIGLDCAEPSLVFDRWLDQLPNIRRVMGSGVYGRMRSSDPPITVPAWASMMTGKDPGQLGFYGFRNRNSYDYADIGLADSTSLTEPTVWGLLGKQGYQSILLGIPPSYPPKPIHGHLVTCFLTPDRSVSYTYPDSLAEEIEKEVGEYQFDVAQFRTAQVEELLKNIYRMTKTRFATARFLLQHKPWDFFMMVEMGIDRIHHACWHLMDENHVLYRPSPHKNAILEYYRYVDGEIGELLSVVPPDTRIFIVSDHGAKRMDGGFCINEWLIKEGYLKLKKAVQTVTPLKPDLVDWKRTRAWGYGGYYGRLCLNVKGREPDGVIPRNQYEQVRNQLIKKLKALTDELGRPLNTKVFKPSKRYLTVKNIPPDLFVYFGNLYWRSVGSIGRGKLYVYENDTGPDGANHDYEGIFISALNRVGKGGQQLPRVHLMDMAPTILHQFGIAPLKGMRGKKIPL
ncbi:alkaline phosphatase family protein [Paenactinomyces guangxiensis]|uniref:Alkaline phosphatase family protein n=1 Tax=Paenactinomyces guangxiensis TaxID=1490290 RepID=A0A7W2A7F0_9BACL|nr:alkaline phosphatase family protein [Paenactinomyces guangxiensis]MBA4494476.1 alkaline phosphatase family protein [Paenactinomyces guangxiensis]MBH8591469.1 alkaline phosphatase family protein [Paenactinomyces guangxiensis]